MVTALEVVWDGINWLAPKIIVVGGAFFLSAWLAMVFWGMVASGSNLTPVSFNHAMLGMIGLWLAIFLAVYVTGRLQAYKSLLQGRMPGRYLQ